ncbi:MAG: tRNA (adenosine(37)-N6)-dimethylallyltransferase MiaA [Oscillospiraceae bacterium]|nr:tRNA (adenosine(37)-N6)-dimethylallyltransferase MiaA [Oscillospiraceae bacterium]
MDNKLICIAGPTASGKTALSVQLAKALGGEIISCDSMQIYRHMDIGTAKPSLEEREDIPHYMLDVADPGEDFSVSRYCEMADPIIADILSRGKYAIVVGGTGLYMDALIRGNTFAPYPSTGMRDKLEAQADALGMEHMLTLLQQIDPDSATRLHLADRKRILRALEVYYETGQTITQHNLQTQQIPPKYEPVWFALEDEDRQELYRRIDRRVLTMLEQGLLGEIRHLLAMGIPEKCTAMQAIGYKEFLDALAGRCSIEEATAQVQQASRHYAKRQLTWFRRNSRIHWLRRATGEDSAKILLRARQILADFDN